MFSLFLQALPDWKELTEVLAWLMAGGGAIVVAALFAFLAENFEWWHKVNKNIKLLISLVLSGLIGFAAYYLMSLPDLLTIVQPYWALFVTMVLAWIGSQYAYLKAKGAGYASKTQAAALKAKKR